MATPSKSAPSLLNLLLIPFLFLLQARPAAASTGGYAISFFTDPLCAGSSVNTIDVYNDAPQGECYGYNIPQAACATITDAWQNSGVIQCNFYADAHCTAYLGEIDLCYGADATVFAGAMGSAQSFNCFWPSKDVSWCKKF